MKPTTICIDTGEPSDLIPAFLAAVSRYAPAHYEGYVAAAFGPIPAYVMDEGPSSSWYESEEAKSLIQDLWEILEQEAPEGFYFGYRPIVAGSGEPRNIGYWPVP